MTEERRLQARYPLEVKIRIDGPRGGQQATMRDISTGGMFVEVQKALPIGQRVECGFELPSDQGTGTVAIEATAEVRHQSAAYRTGEGQGPYRGMGLRFLRVSAEGAEAIGRYVRTRSG